LELNILASISLAGQSVFLNRAGRLGDIIFSGYEKNVAYKFDTDREDNAFQVHKFGHSVGTF
jgi:hypothetical protein